MAAMTNGKEWPVSAQTLSGLADTSALQLFMDFPIPLALLHADGHVELTNGRFNESVDGRCLESDAMREVVVHPGRPWQPFQLPRRRGGVVAARVRAMRISNRTLLALDTAPDEGDADEIRQLHKRILELERTSSSDHLTGAWNRAHLDRTIESELSRSLRYQQPLSLILMDIDHFKRVNDEHGHQAGDAVLRELVKLIGANIRSADLLFRWGGDEFVVLVSASGYRAAERLGNQLRAVLEQHDFAGAGRVTVSIGVAEHSGSESAEVWFGRLDAALYAAKHQGRNRIVVDRRGNSDDWLTGHRLPALRLVWQEAYECGQPLIDGQHRRLFELANALMDAAMASDAAPAACDAALAQLFAHIAGHFADEEALLAAKGYPHLAEHKLAHARLLAKAGAFQVQAGSGAVKLGDLIDFLVTEVVAKHMMTMDRDFYPLFAPADGAPADRVAG